MKSLRRLTGLFLVSLFIASIWLSSLPGAEDPWDKNKVVQSDSSTALGHGGLWVPGNTHIGVFFDNFGLFKGPGIRILLVPDLEATGNKASKCERAPARGVKLKIDTVEDNGNRKTRK